MELTKPAKQWNDKQQLQCFLILTFAVTSIFHIRFIFFGGLAGNPGLIFPMMWTPGIIGLLCSWYFGHNFKDLGFRRISINQIVIAYAVPAFAACLVFILLLLCQIDSLGIRSKYLNRFGSPEGVLFAMILVAPIFGVFSAMLRSLGEEIGWRGFLHSRMLALKWRHPYLIIGLIWALWHLPAILFADYSSSDIPLLSAIIFTGVAVAASVFMGWLREFTDSLWPAVITHASHNVWIQQIYPAFIKKGPLDAYFGGESGLFLLMIYGTLAYYLYERKLPKYQ